MSELALSTCPICYAEDSLSRQTKDMQDSHYIWYECHFCGAALLWLGNGRWAYQHIGPQAKAYLLKQPLTVAELQALVPKAEEDIRAVLAGRDASVKAVPATPASSATVEDDFRAVWTHSDAPIEAVPATPASSATVEDTIRAAVVDSEAAARATERNGVARAGQGLFFAVLALCIVGIFVVVAIVASRFAQDLPGLAPTGPAESPAPTDTPTAPGRVAGGFVDEVQACNSAWHRWNSFGEEVAESQSATYLCGSWIERADPAMRALVSCWEDLPRVEDSNLSQAWVHLQVAGTRYEKVVAKVRQVCEGSGSLEGVAGDLEGAKVLVNRATKIIDAYR